MTLLLTLAAAGYVGVTEAEPPHAPLVRADGKAAGGWWALRPDPLLDSSGQRLEGRVRAVPPTMAVGQYPKARPLVAEFGPKQIDDTALFNFSDQNKPLVLYGGGVQLNIGIDPLYSTSVGAIFADESTGDTFHLYPLTVVDLGRYRTVLQTLQYSGQPAPLFIKSSDLAKNVLQANLIAGLPTPPAATFQVLFRFYPDGTQIGALNEGEVALFQQCNYQGKAAVFAVDLPSFAELTSNVITLDGTAASVKLGNNTGAVLHSGPIYTGTRTVIKVDTPCLAGPANTTSLLVRPLDRVIALGARDCSNCRLVGANLARVDLSGFTLDGADLTNANLACANLSGSDNNHRVDLTKVTLTNAQFGTDPSCRTNLSWSIFNPDVIPASQWRYLDLRHAIVEGLAGKVLSSQSSPLNLAGAMLSGAQLQNAILDYATGLAGADLAQIVLTHASLRHVDLNAAVLYGASLDRANLEGANMADAYLSPCPPPGSCLGASLVGAHLKNVNLSSAHLESAKFDTANFYSTSPVGDHSCDTTSGLCASARNATLTGTRFVDTYLYGVDFGGARIRGAIFDRAVLVGTTFDGATVAPLPGQANSSFADTFLQGADLATATIDNVTMVGAFLDFAPKGNTMLIQLNSKHTQFAGWEAPGQPVCARMTYGAWASVPTRNSTITCPDGTVSPPAGCGLAAWSPPLNAHWNNGRNIATTDPKASYRFDATYTNHAPDICTRNIAW